MLLKRIKFLFISLIDEAANYASKCSLVMSLNKNKLINIIFPDRTIASDNKSIAKIYSSFLCLRRKK